MDEAAEFAPCRLVAHQDGSFSLLFLDFAVTDRFEQMGRLGNGYAWQSVIEYLVATNEPALSDKIRYDSEADMFVAVSRDRSTLKQLAALIRQAIGDPAMLGQAISNAEPDLPYV